MRSLLLLAILAVPVFGTLPRVDPHLQANLREAINRLGLEPLAAEQRLSISLLDLSDPAEEHYASVNDRRMMYAASLPKLGILLSAFEAIHNGLMPRAPVLESSLTRMIRQSSNGDASALIQRLGYAFIERTLTSERYRLYDPDAEGGLWVGKSYGPSGLRRHVEFWRPEPISGEWHAANSLQVARFFWLLSRGALVDDSSSAAMKRILGKSDTSDYFLEGLRGESLTNVYRKSGTFGDMHCDAALVEHLGRKYVAVAMVNDASGPRVLPRLIRELHRLVM